MELPGVRKNVTLAPFTTYKIGGRADLFVEVHSKEELVDAVKWAREEGKPYFILGTGANILVTDKGFRGLVIHNLANKVELLPRSKVRAESGTTMARLIELTSENNLSGFETFQGIPSSVGGAIWQNLHFLAPDREQTLYIESIVDRATVLMPTGFVKEVEKRFFEFSYDDSVLHHREIIVLDVTFQLTSKPKEAILEQARLNQAWRNDKQPQLWEYPSCGSVFKKIAGVGAGRLIQDAGLKGRRIGGIVVSAKHANYLVNVGGATANDVLKMIELIQKEVKKHSGYELDPEIRIVGET